MIRDRDGVEQDPTQPVDPRSSLEFLFDEPMASDSFRPYESFFVADDPASTNPGLAKIGRVTFDRGGKRATFRPEREIQFGADAGTAENVGFGSDAQALRFHIKVVPTKSTIASIAGEDQVAEFLNQGLRGVTDVGGQPLAFPLNMLSPSSLTVDYSLAFSTTADPSITDYGAIVHRFQGQAKTGFGADGTTGVTYLDVTPDICGPNGNIYGPRIADLNLFANGFLSGAPVQFFQKIHDDLNPPPTGQLTAFPFGAATPLGGNALLGGARFIHLYRAVDASPDWEALAGTKLDLRNVAWAPSGGGVTNTTIPDLQIHAGHSSITPDTKQNAGIPTFPQSGMSATQNNNAMGGHHATLGNPSTPLVDGPYDAVVANTGEKLVRELVYGTPKPGTLADNFNGKPYHIDNANLFVPPGTNRNYHPLPNGDFDTFFPYNNGAADVKTFSSATGFGQQPTWGGTLGARKPQSLLLEYRVRVQSNEVQPATSNGFTFAVGILSSALPRFRIFSYGAGCTSCCFAGGTPGNNACRNTCAFAYTPMNGAPGNGSPLEPDLITHAAGPAPAPPGMNCFCLPGAGGVAADRLPGRQRDQQRRADGPERRLRSVAEPEQQQLRRQLALLHGVQLREAGVGDRLAVRARAAGRGGEPAVRRPDLRPAALRHPGRHGVRHHLPRLDQRGRQRGGHDGVGHAGRDGAGVQRDQRGPEHAVPAVQPRHRGRHDDAARPRDRGDRHPVPEVARP